MGCDWQTRQKKEKSLSAQRTLGHQATQRSAAEGCGWVPILQRNSLAWDKAQSKRGNRVQATPKQTVSTNRSTTNKNSTINTTNTTYTSVKSTKAILAIQSQISEREVNIKIHLEKFSSQKDILYISSSIQYNKSCWHHAGQDDSILETGKSLMFALQASQPKTNSKFRKKPCSKERWQKMIEADTRHHPLTSACLYMCIHMGTPCTHACTTHIHTPYIQIHRQTDRQREEGDVKLQTSHK